MLRQRNVLAKASTAFRTDIEGLRAVAVLAVLLWHAQLSWVPGGYVGVDVFFVISGFLMTSILVREAQRTGTISLSSFYARRIRRILPAAVAALLGTAVLTVAFLPRQRWTGIGWDMLTSAGYVVNWRMADVAGDYLTQSEPPSPLQHYWSLAVEEQFYLFWPAAVLAACLVARMLGGRKSARPLLWVGCLAIVGVSLWLSILLTGRGATAAYFVTYTRAWELGLGALVALGAAWWPRMPRWLASALGWIGLLMVLSAILAFDSSTSFPGYAALLPTVGAALILIAGPAAGRSGPVRVLQPAPMQVVGRLSYSLYLWHWPFVVVAMSVFGDGHDVSPVYGVAAVLVSAPVAWACFRYVEQPLRGRRRQPRDTRWLRSSLLLGWNCTVVGVLAGGLLTLLVWPGPLSTDPRWRVVAAGSQQEGEQAFGAMALGAEPTRSDRGEPVDDPGVINPSPSNIDADLPVFRPQGCQADFAVVEVKICAAGDPDGDVLIALIGDSHAAQWVTALDLAGRDQGWRIAQMTKVSCPPVLGQPINRLESDRPYDECSEWNDRLQDAVLDVDPDLVLMSSAAAYDLTEDEMGAALMARADGLSEQQVDLALIRDTPRPARDMAECVQNNLGELRECAFTRADALSRSGLGQAALSEARPNLTVLDLTDYICPREACAAVIGGVSVYRDTNHVSATYVASLTDALESRVTGLLETSTSDPGR